KAISHLGSYGVKASIDRVICQVTLQSCLIRTGEQSCINHVRRLGRHYHPGFSLSLGLAPQLQRCFVFMVDLHRKLVLTVKDFDQQWEFHCSWHFVAEKLCCVVGTQIGQQRALEWSIGHAAHMVRMAADLPGFPKHSLSWERFAKKCL